MANDMYMHGLYVDSWHRERPACSSYVSQLAKVKLGFTMSVHLSQSRRYSQRNTLVSKLNRGHHFTHVRLENLECLEPNDQNSQFTTSARLIHSSPSQEEFQGTCTSPTRFRAGNPRVKVGRPCVKKYHYFISLSAT